jgi:hypothetical protein
MTPTGLEHMQETRGLLQLSDDPTRNPTRAGLLADVDLDALPAHVKAAILALVETARPIE